MIINTGGRTDIVQYYTKWLLNRFEAGYVYSRNPLFGNKVTRYELVPEKVDAVHFCSKNYAPILPHITKITRRFPAYFHYTITAYGQDLEPGVPSIEESVNTLIQLSKTVGKQRLAWRYDPILLTEDYTVQTHLNTFADLAQTLTPYVDRCIFNFVEMYKKLKVNMPELKPCTEQQKDELAKGMGEIASACGLQIQTCGNNGDFSHYGIEPSGCVTLDLVGKANGIQFRKLKHKGMRPGCGCIETRDIGAYDTCMNGCKYCYANQRPEKAFENYRYHDSESPLLLGHLRESDTIQNAMQKSFRSNESVQGQIIFDELYDRREKEK